MLSISTIARVIVNTIRSSEPAASWDTGLLLVKDSSYTAEKRLHSYASASEAAAGMAADGFASSTEAYKAAQKYFAASPSPARLLVSCYPSSESLSDALNAVLALRSDFYGVALADSCMDAALLTFHTHITGLEKPVMLFLSLTGMPASVAASGSLLSQLNAAASWLWPRGAELRSAAFRPGITLRMASLSGRTPTIPSPRRTGRRTGRFRSSAR